MITFSKPEQCCAVVKRNGYWTGQRCGNVGKIQRDDKFYCGVHDPEHVKDVREKRGAERRTKWAEQAAYRQVQANAAERQRKRAEMFSELVEQLKVVTGLVDEVSMTDMDQAVELGAKVTEEIEKARQLIARAEEVMG